MELKDFIISFPAHSTSGYDLDPTIDTLRQIRYKNCLSFINTCYFSLIPTMEFFIIHCSLSVNNHKNQIFIHLPINLIKGYKSQLGNMSISESIRFRNVISDRSTHWLGIPSYIGYSASFWFLQGLQIVTAYLGLIKYHHSRRPIYLIDGWIYGISNLLYFLPKLMHPFSIYGVVWILSLLVHSFFLYIRPIYRPWRENEANENWDKLVLKSDVCMMQCEIPNNKFKAVYLNK